MLFHSCSVNNFVKFYLYINYTNIIEDILVKFENNNTSIYINIIIII